jgi:predicted nuclease of predicted toxin-antitoxin system
MARILLDTCVWGGALEPLRRFGHDVVWSGSWEKDPGDQEILTTAHEENRILVTLDKDFGELAVFRQIPHSGIVRLSGFQTSEMAAAIHHILDTHERELLAGAVISADPIRLRIRKSQ